MSRVDRQMYGSSSFNKEASIFQRLEGNMRHLDDLIDTQDLSPSEHQIHHSQTSDQKRKSMEKDEDDRQQDHGFGNDGAASDRLGELLPHAFHDPGKRLRAASPQWSIATLRSADNTPSISKEQLAMEAEDSPWGGSSARLQHNFGMLMYVLL